MRSESEKQKLLLFMGTLTVLAFAINITVAFNVRGNSRPEARRSSSTQASSLPVQTYSRPMEVRQRENRNDQIDRNAIARAAAEREAIARATFEREEAARRAAQAAAEAHANYLARYIRAGTDRNSAAVPIALVAATENKRSNRAVGDALALRLHDSAVTFLPTFFNPEFVSDGLFNEAFNEPSALPRKLELGNVLKGLLVARQSVEYTTNDNLQSVVTANMRLEVLALPIAEDAQRQVWTFTAYGAGFNSTAARSLAEERLIKQIGKDTKMSLIPFSIRNLNQ